MKKYVLLSIMSVCSFTSFSQTLGEWINQKNTQKKYLVQQIAGLQVYIGFANKGYKIAKSGLNSINSIKNGDYIIHSNYFNELRVINPSIKKTGAVDEIISINHQVLQLCKKIELEGNRSNLILSDEMNYLRKVVKKVSKDCYEILDDVKDVITRDQLEMQDSQRLNRIEALGERIMDNLLFCKVFYDDLRVLIKNRSSEIRNLKTELFLNQILEE